MKDVFRHIIGYTLGIFIFAILIPYELYQSREIEGILNITLINNEIFRTILAIPIFIIGVVFMLWSNLYLFRIGKGGPAEGFGFAVSPRIKKLVTCGP
jgi:hypothetical protein